MNERKISFIYCVNNEVLYNESIKYINSLHIPDGYEVDIIAVTKALSLTQGYNEGMKRSDAKYKVYLHQDVLVINKNFIQEIINIFSHNAQLGMLGVFGATRLPVTGMWWKATDRVGKVYENSRSSKMGPFVAGDVQGDYQSVQAIDGLIMITQYDLAWREDLFKGWHFYDVSQALEFQRAGYEVGVPNQSTPWCLHDCGSLNLEGYEEQRRIFLNEYYKEVCPLVSVVIPAYNRPHLLEVAIQSVLNQSYKNIEIIICDDSTNSEVGNMLKPYMEAYPEKINYFKNEKQLEAENFKKCFSLASGEYVNFLMDDDVFHEEKIEKMMNYLAQLPDVTLVTSYRKLIDDHGNMIPDRHFNRQLFKEDKILDGRSLGDLLLKTTSNLIGEPTTVLFRKSLVTEFGVYKSKEYSVINDFATWINLLAKGKAVYIAEPLSYFRQHQSQNQKNPKYMVHGISNWFNLIMDSRKDGFLSNQKDFKESLRNYLAMAQRTIATYNELNKTEVLVKNSSERYCAEAINQLIHAPDLFHCSLCNHSFEKFNFWPDKFDAPLYKFEMFNKYTAGCPKCRSFDRERLYKLYIQNETNLLSSNFSRILHVAPESNLRKWINNIGLDYVCGDLYPQDRFMEKMDITQISYADESFDVILCSHVLEHIPNDLLAMKELFRVLKKGGWGILQVPIAINIENTFEDPTIVTPEQRHIYFGQDDHVRVYSKNDYISRLRSVGFDVELYNYADKFGVHDAARYGLSPTDDLYIVRKK
ncbi:glycosyltransferase [Bacillus sp. 3255]|uniref:glycosyltransferase n=1 Tax=Bacillus sp. 3255 TaxID=2817904 RepID=UPI00286501B8|nr:glycosyltransferase [Bacillus sp. 3255]MDR6883470.1 glycosyltransferase involved in cell wall biosynthesis/predicted SAM-dependent methyltransferase [Bacillus sp. 3255]